MKLCVKCGTEPRHGNNSYCHGCRAIYLRDWAKKHPEKTRAATRIYRHRHPDVLARYNHDAKVRRRYRCRQRLGGKCVCCGETRDSFLDIDHVHGGGSQQRRAFGPHRAYAEVLQMENPQEKYQLLCSNCNQSKRRLGRCEHEAEREKEKGA